MKKLHLESFLLFITINLHFTTIFADIQCYDDRKSIFEKCDSINAHAQLTCESSKNIGVAKLNFTISNSSEYDVTLFVNETISKDDCENEEISVNVWKTHSKIVYTKTNNSLFTPCNKFGEIEFPYVYNGCYKVKIKKQDGLYVPITTETKYLSTNYTKNYINITSKFIYEYYVKSYSFSLTINNSFINEEIELDFKLIKLNNSEIISTWRILCPLNSDNCIFKDEQTTNITCNIYTFDKPKITCWLKNIEEGEYRMNVELLNDTRCEGQIGSAWKSQSDQNVHSKPCLFIIHGIRAQRNIQELEPKKEEENSSKLIWIVLIIALILIITCVIFIIYVRKRAPFTSEDAMLYSPVEQQINESFDIFLLYARDCDVVMETMTALKQVLEEFIRCNVHDIYDPSSHQELSTSPMDWVWSRLSRPPRRMKTLLLASHCGHLQLQHRSVLYRRPRFYDNLFRFAVRLLADNARCSSHESLFVLSLSADGPGDYESFGCFTPGRRFPLPQTLHALLRQLGCADVEDTDTVVRFREKCAEMERYFGENRGYVGDVLDVQVEGV